MICWRLLWNMSKRIHNLHQFLQPPGVWMKWHILLSSDNKSNNLSSLIAIINLHSLSRFCQSQKNTSMNARDTTTNPLKDHMSQMIRNNSLHTNLRKYRSCWCSAVSVWCERPDWGLQTLTVSLTSDASLQKYKYGKIENGAKTEQYYRLVGSWYL